MDGWMGKGGWTGERRGEGAGGVDGGRREAGEGGESWVVVLVLVSVVVVVLRGRR